MMDYNLLRDLPLELVKKMGIKIKTSLSQNIIMQQIKKKKDTYKSINSDRLSNKVIKIFYGFKVGLLKMNIPKDENVLQKLIRKIFSKKEA